MSLFVIISGSIHQNMVNILWLIDYTIFDRLDFLKENELFFKSFDFASWIKNVKLLHCELKCSTY